MIITIFGASGGIGRHAVEAALAEGHHVRAYLRAPSKLGVAHPRLTVVAGGLGDLQKIAEVVRGADAVVNTLGWTAGITPSELTAGVVRIFAAMQSEGVKRFITSSGAGTQVEGDRRNVRGKVILWAARTFAPKLVEQKQSEYDALRTTKLEWTVARPPNLLDRPSRGFRVSDVSPPSLSVARADVARFLISQVNDERWIRRAPFVSW